MDNNQMIKHWQEICGDAPESFRRRAQSTLYNLRSQSTRRRMKPALAMAPGLTLLLGSAFAPSQLGLLDGLNPALRKDLLPEATQMVKSNIPSRQSSQNLPASPWKKRSMTATRFTSPWLSAPATGTRPR